MGETQKVSRSAEGAESAETHLSHQVRKVRSPLGDALRTALPGKCGSAETREAKKGQPELPGLPDGRRWETVTLTGGEFLALCAELENDKSRWLQSWDSPTPGTYICHVKRLTKPPPTSDPQQ
jgi:hypothetical protein